MPKPLIQDIIKKKSTSEKPGRKESINEKIEPKKPMKLPRVHFPGNFRPKLKLIAGFAFLGVLICAFLFVVNKISVISVEITPIQQFVEIDDILGASISPQKDELPIEMMQLSRAEKGTTIPTGKKQINRKASGQIMVYNAFSSDPQTLIKNTRFEAPDGKIYRTDKTIVVPGTKVIEGKIIPGEAETTVFADKPGEEYNIELVDFTIPGFENSAKREKIYGRSKTEMKGGFVGEVSVIAESDIKNLQSSLREKIKNYFSGAVKNPKPEDFLLYDGAKQIVFENKNNGFKAGDESNLLEFEESAVFYGFLLKKTDVSQMLAEKYLRPEIAYEVEIVNSEKLVFELKNFTPTTVVFRLKGTAHFSRKIDNNALKNSLIEERKEPNSAFQKYPSIEKARIVFKPSWWKFVPKDSSRIAIVTILKEKL